MEIPTPENQTFSEKTLKGFLLKGVDPKSTNPTIQMINKILTKQVDAFWEAVVVPLRKGGKLDGNKINWYFQIYKEGYEARKLVVHPFTAMVCDRESIVKIVREYEGKTIQQYLELGTSYLSNTLSILNAWSRDQLLMKRLTTIYKSDNPVDWIMTAEKEEHGIMKENTLDIQGLRELVQNITLLLARRV